MRKIPINGKVFSKDPEDPPPGDCRGPLQNLLASGAHRIPHRTSVARKPARRQRRRPQNKPTAVRLSSLSNGWKNGRESWRHWNGWQARRLDVDTPSNPSRSNMSSKLPSVLSATDEEIQLLLSAQSHIGSKNCDKQMLSYVWKRRSDG